MTTTLSRFLRALMIAPVLGVQIQAQCPLNYTITCANCSQMYNCPSGISSVSVQYGYGLNIDGCSPNYSGPCDNPEGQFNCFVTNVAYDYYDCSQTHTYGNAYICCEQQY